MKMEPYALSHFCAVSCQQSWLAYQRVGGKRANGRSGSNVNQTHSLSGLFFDSYNCYAGLSIAPYNDFCFYYIIVMSCKNSVPHLS